ncbi:uncharacterized protein LOC143296329 [Babylonia areolata]|uniref:uncharacterized protein LOC143296329 n=1 Tax=Babylonia areolata TaxID=304850 RepID=UPI003FD33296
MARPKAQNDPWIPLTEVTGIISQPPCDPRYQLIDSDRYIESLERKLKRIKGRNKPEPSSRDIIDSLAGFKDDQMRRFLHNGHTITSEPSSSVIAADVATSSSSMAFLQRRLHPERQALNMEELFELLKDDELARNRLAEGEEDEAELMPISQTNCARLSEKDVSDDVSGNNSKETDSGEVEGKNVGSVPENGQGEQGGTDRGGQGDCEAGGPGMCIASVPEAKPIEEDISKKEGREDCGHRVDDDKANCGK